MSNGTGLKYLGSHPIYAFKRTLSKGSFIDLQELFRLHGRKSGYDTPSKNFVMWFFEEKIRKPNKHNFELLIDQEDFDEEGNYLGDVPSHQLNRKNSEERVPKSSQVVSQSSEVEEDEELSEEKASGSSGTVEVVSTPVEVAATQESAETHLLEQARALRENKPKNKAGQRGTIVNTSEKKAISPSNSKVISGDMFNRSSFINSRAVVIDGGGNPVGVEGISEGSFVSKSGDSPNVFVAEPESSATRNVGPGSEVINYGGKSTVPPGTNTKYKTEAPKEKIRGGNTMSQPAMASHDALRSSITVDDIVRNPNETKAVELVNKCRDAKVLKAAAKKLRQDGSKVKLENAVRRRLNLLPPGSV